MIGFEPTAPRSQSECSTKLSYIPLTMDLSVYYVGATPSILTVSHRSKTGVLPEYPKGDDSQLQGFGISEPLGTFGWNVSSPLCNNYTTSCVPCQMVPSAASCICGLPTSPE